MTGGLGSRGVGVDDEVVPHRAPRGIEAPGERSVAVPVPERSLPGDHEAAGRGHADRRVALAAGGVAVHLELAPQPVARGVVALAEDGGVGAVAVAVVVLPDRDEVAVDLDGEAAPHLLAGRIGVHHELAADGIARRIEPAGGDRVGAAVGAGAHPAHDEPAIGGSADLRPVLEPGGVRVDQELAADRAARGVVAPALDARVRTVLDALPDHDEVPAAHDRDRGSPLEPGRMDVDAELAASRSPRRGVPLREHPVVVSILGGASPDDDEVPVRLHRRADRPLAVGRVGVDPELPSGGSLGRGSGGEGQEHETGPDGILDHRRPPSMRLRGFFTTRTTSSRTSRS